MKTKLFILMSVFSICYSSVFAQDISIGVASKEKNVYCRLGIIGGLDLSKISNPGGIDSDFKAGFSIGAAFNMRFLKRNERSSAETGILAIQPEIRYASMGGNDLSLNYLMVPIMLQAYPLQKWYIEAGPEIATLLSSSDKYAKDAYVYNLSNLKSKDIMIGIGLGYCSNGFSCGLRYNIGTSDLASNLPWKNTLIQINVGYCFSLSKKTSQPIKVLF